MPYESSPLMARQPNDDSTRQLLWQGNLKHYDRKIRRMLDEEEKIILYDLQEGHHYRPRYRWQSIRSDRRIKGLERSIGCFLRGDRWGGPLCRMFYNWHQLSCTSPTSSLARLQKKRSFVTKKTTERQARSVRISKDRTNWIFPSRGM
jgi:hypothetical protein